MLSFEHIVHFKGLHFDPQGGCNHLVMHGGLVYVEVRIQTVLGDGFSGH